MKVVEKITSLWALCGGFLLLAIMLVTSINASSFALNRLGIEISALPGYEDFISLVIASASLMFLPYCQCQKGHIVVDLFSNFPPNYLEVVLDKIWLGVLSVLLIFLGYWMIIGMLETYQDGVLTPVLGWSTWGSYLPGILSIFLWILICFAQIFQNKNG